MADSVANIDRINTLGATLEDTRRRISGVSVALVAVTLLAVVAPVEARRLALVIGNDSYQHADALSNARADAKAVADALRATGFKVTLKQDVTQQAMKEAIRTFKSEVAGGDEIIFYYAGHGVQLEGNNYMIPVDTAGENPDQLK
ncbi:MAG TPA: caspase family protein, partial [Steroidobacteraceae bacterium]